MRGRRKREYLADVVNYVLIKIIINKMSNRIKLIQRKKHWNSDIILGSFQFSKQWNDQFLAVKQEKTYLLFLLPFYNINFLGVVESSIKSDISLRMVRDSIFFADLFLLYWHSLPSNHHLSSLINLSRFTVSSEKPTYKDDMTACQQRFERLISIYSHNSK